MTTRSIHILLTVLAVLVAAGCKQDAAKPAPGPAAAADRVSIAVTGQGFTPRDVAVPRGKPVTLVFERKTDETCAKEVVLVVGDQTIQKSLPLNQPVEIAVTFPEAGKLTYTCGMDMVKGIVTVQ